MVKLEQIHYNDWILFSHTNATADTAAAAAAQFNVSEKYRFFLFKYDF